MQQKRYWKMMVQIFGQARYLHLYREKCECYERRLSIISAITSSASIAGWAIWQELSCVWAVIIAVSQVVSAIRPFFPFARRAESLRDASAGIKNLSVLMEARWFDVSQGILTELEINNLIATFLKQQDDIEAKLFSASSLKDRPDLCEKATEATEAYFSKIYE